MLSSLQNHLRLAKDLLTPIHAEHLLNGHKLFRPFLSYQKRWLRHFYPREKIDLNRSSWWHLHRYVLPTILEYASSYHIEGILRLNLNTNTEPHFETLQKKFAAESEFQIEPVIGELSPRVYFKLILQKKIPCSINVRPHSELFCGIEPDFWHEALGHIAPLCCKEVQAFYLALAEHMLSINDEVAFNHDLSIIWTLTEYGFLQEKNQYKMFGAALVSSHFAHMRWAQKMIMLEPAKHNTILASNFYDENTPIPRHASGKLRFFYLNDLNVETIFLPPSKQN